MKYELIWVKSSRWLFFLLLHRAAYLSHSAAATFCTTGLHTSLLSGNAHYDQRAYAGQPDLKVDSLIKVQTKTALLLFKLFLFNKLNQAFFSFFFTVFFFLSKSYFYRQVANT